MLTGADTGVLMLTGSGVLGCGVDESNAKARVATAMAANDGGGAHHFSSPARHAPTGEGWDRDVWLTG